MKLKISFLPGIKLKTFVRTVNKNEDVIMPKALGDGIVTLIFATFNTLVGLWEDFKHERAILNTEIKEDPIFILGHWRSGTTHLQYTLDKDPNIHSPSTFECLFPSTFLTTEDFLKPLLNRVTPKKRVQDNMEGGMDYPNEDEIALAVLTGCSPYLSWSFPKESRFEKYLTFKNVGNISRQKWKREFLLFAKKLTYKHNKRLLFKSPAHTARIDLIKDIFPNAKFVHIMRSPEKVYSSTHYFYQKFKGEYAFMQDHSELNFEAKMTEMYKLMYDSYANEKKRTDIHSIDYEKLVESPLEVLEGIYKYLNIGNFEDIKPTFENYLASIKNYKNVKHDDLTDGQREEISKHWRPIWESNHG